MCHVERHSQGLFLSSETKNKSCVLFFCFATPPLFDGSVWAFDGRTGQEELCF